MSVFSEKLQECITKSNMKIASLSKISGVERSFIQKMLTGERIPSDPAVLQQLADALMLSPSQRRMLLDSYSISKMGEATYYRRLLVKRLIEETNSFLQPAPVLRSTYPNPGFQRPSVLSLHGKGAIADTVRLLVEEELSGASPRLRLVLQPESLLIPVLLAYGRTCPALQIEHILCFDSELQYQKENKYNLGCLRGALSFLLAACRYVPYFYYEVISPKTGKTALFPWMILGTDWAVSLSQDEEAAVVLSDREAVSLYEGLFEEVREECHPVLEHSGQEQFFDAQNWSPLKQEMTYSLQFEPCFGFFFTMNMAQQQICRDLPNREELLSFFDERRKQISLLDGARKNTSFFTLEGLDRFLESGRIGELPEDCYLPFPKPFRVELLRRMLACTQNQSYSPYLIKPAKFRIPQALYFLVTGPQQVTCSCTHPIHGRIHLNIQENSVAYSFCDFFEYLKETGLVYSKEETQAVLRQRLEALARS